VILVDTSIWINHFRGGDRELIEHLETGLVTMHPFVIGELSLGNLQNRDEILTALGNLAPVKRATEDDVLKLIANRNLWGRGIGYIDAHLLASAIEQPGVRLWTGDKRLAACALEMGIGYQPTQ